MLLYINYKKRGIIEYIKSGNQSQKNDSICFIAYPVDLNGYALLYSIYIKVSRNSKKMAH